MYVPEHFRESRPEVLHDFMRQHSFAALVSHTDRGLVATHLPLLLDADRGRHGTLIGHVARANDHWRSLASGQDVMVIFQGPHAYISPQWYATPISVPTWNYAVVHAYGTARLIDDDAELRRVLDTTVSTFEAVFDYQWRPPEGDYVEKLMRNVVGFEIAISRLEGKLKMSQNRSPADRQGAIAGLRRQGGPMGTAVAELMERTVKPD